MVNYQVNAKKGFTIIELMIVIAIIGVIVAIAYPKYQNSIIKAKRGDMMVELQNIATRIESQKLTMGSYNNIPIAQIYAGTTTAGATTYPYKDTPLYDVTIWNADGTPAKITAATIGTANWELRATPKTTSAVKDDGMLKLTSSGIKCRGTACGTGQEWNQ